MKFPRKERLTTQADFRYVFSGATASRDQYFRVLGRSNGREHCRLGLAVSRKVCKKAVGRNRLKRLIRESFRQQGGLLSPGQGIDIVVLPAPPATTICNKTLAKSLLGHWQNLQDCVTRQPKTNNRKNVNG